MAFIASMAVGAAKAVGPMLPTIAKIGGIGLQAFGNLQQGTAAADEAQGMAEVAQYNAQVQEREARAIEYKSRFEQERQADFAKRVKSELQASISAQGGRGTGTSLLIEGKTAEELELENILIGYEGQIGAQRARSQAEIDKMQAGIYKQKAKNLKKAGSIGAGTSLLSGLGGMFT